MTKPSVVRTVASVLAVVFGFALTYVLIAQHGFSKTNKAFDWTISKIGTQMLGTEQQGFSLPFEVVSVLLLAAMIGCIVIAIKIKPSDK